MFVFNRTGLLRNRIQQGINFKINKFSTTVMTYKKKEIIDIDNLNPNVKKVEYAVRGPIVIKASQLEKELGEGVKHPFEQVIKANIGDCHAMGQKGITFIRQVIAACTYPPLMEQKNFPEDVNSRAKQILSTIHGSTGCYSASVGLDIVRKHVAQYIETRDGYPSSPDNILVTNGASSAVKLILEMFVNPNKQTGIMIPIPQYPLYSATVDEFGMQQVGYYLKEENNWSLEISELKRALEEARKTCDVRCLCVINPGNPTGQVLSYDNIREILKFAAEEGLFVIADEVYQDNIYGEGCAFHPFKKVLHDLGEEFSNGFQLASLHSCSKGFMGECGLRGGYVETIGLSDKVHYQLNKLQSAQLGSNVTGQLVLDCITNPPKKGDASYELFAKERDGILSSLKKRARSVYETLDSIEGVTCNEVQGAMYAFPRINLPKKAIEKAESLGQAADFYYCSRLLDEEGICVVPGSGFGQANGTWHFRMTILPPENELEIFLKKYKEFHLRFMNEFSE